MTTTPTILHTHFSLQPHLISHPSGQLNVDPSHTCSPSPSPPLSSPKALYTPPPPSPTPDVPGVWVSVFVERVRTKRPDGDLARQMDGCAVPVYPGLSICAQLAPLN